jgi:hypothetical protein
LSSPTPHRFNDPVWPIREVLGWVLDRDPAKFGRLCTDEDIKSALFSLNDTKGLEHDPQVLKTVLHALQRGDLVAYAGTDPVPRNFWTDKTRQYIRDATDFLFRREDVVALWPTPPLNPVQSQAVTVHLRAADQDRAPNWQKWKHVPNVKLYEAVALSLNIAPEKLQRSPSAWMSGKRFEESDEFDVRLFVAQRNLNKLRPLNTLAMRYYDEDPVVKIRNFVEWALSIGWTLPRELSGSEDGASGPSLSVVARNTDAIPSRPARGNPDPDFKRANQRRAGRKKGSGAIDDTPRLRTMLELLATGQATSVHNAARQVAESMPRTSQSQTVEITRFRSKFSKAYGTQPPEGKAWADVAAELKGN